MISTTEFENLLSKSESSLLDFKRDFYDFNNKPNESAKFIKDIISFSNTIRNETSFIIFGIKEKTDGELDLIGLENKEDDAILQERARHKIYPKANFKYYTLKFKERLFAILEFPVTKYDKPLSPTEKMKGLEPGKFYFRNGTSNTEATGMESIRINEWLNDLPNLKNGKSISNKISDLIIKLSKKEEKLSIVISEILSFAKENNWSEIVQFCTVQLKGIRYKTDYNSSYRDHKILGSLLRVEFESNPFINATPARLRSELNENKDFYKTQITFTQSLIKLEEYIERFEQTSGVAMTVEERNTKQLSRFDMDAPFYIYCLEEDYKTVYNNIRQKTIDLLMEK
ncbi:ATP-binding protein [Salegentibacter agarivorans]